MPGVGGGACEDGRGAGSGGLVWAGRGGLRRRGVRPAVGGAARAPAARSEAGRGAAMPRGVRAARGRPAWAPAPAARTGGAGKLVACGFGKQRAWARARVKIRGSAPRSMAPTPDMWTAAARGHVTASRASTSGRQAPKLLAPAHLS